MEQTRNIARYCTIDIVSLSEVVMGIDIIFKIAGVGLITAVIGSILKKCDKGEIATMVTIAGLIIVVAMVVDLALSMFDSIKEILGF